MDINFCNNCNNLLYLYKNDKNELVYCCKSCGNIQEYTRKTNIYKQSDINKSEIINTNKNLVNDITLPRLSNKNIKCINSECKSITQNKKSSIIYIKYNPDELKYIYICENCGKKWTNN